MRRHHGPQRTIVGVRSGCRAFTMIELVVSLAVVSILLAAMGSTILLATKALPSGTAPDDRVVDAGGALGKFTEELRAAVHITERTATAVTFTVADRSGDGVPERIRYAWSGTPGHPLTRQYNNAAAASVLKNVYRLDLGYELKAVTETYPGPPVESAEMALMSYESLEKLSEVHVHDNLWWAQYFKPTLPADTLSWAVTRVLFLAKRDHDDDYATAIELRLPTVDNMPGATVIDSASMAQMSLTNSFMWVEKGFAAATGLSPDQGLCLTFSTADPNSCKLQYKSSGVTLPNTGFVAGNPAWQGLVTDQAFLFYVFGRYTSPGPPQTATRQHVSAVRITIQAGATTAGQVETSVNTLNVPEALSAVWQADFSADPTSVDLNGDGPDWNVRNGGAIHPSKIHDGIWDVGADALVELDTAPDDGFAELTTVDLRFRCTQTNGGGIYFQINADYTGGGFTPAVATIELLPDGTQQLTVTAGAATLVRISGLPADFVTLRLLIDPGPDTNNIVVDGTDRGTYSYIPSAPTTEPRCATLHDWGSNGQWDYVRIRVGGTGS